MNYYAFVLPGMEKICQQEFKELINIKATINHSVLEFSPKNKEDLIYLLLKSQSVKKILISLGKYDSLDNLNFDQFNLNDFFSSEFSFKIDVENVKGQDNRVEIAKNVSTFIFNSFKKIKPELKPEIEFKNPDMKVIVHFNNNEYFIGIDLSGTELNARSYRLFPHSASFKGDLGYYFVKRSRFISNNKLLVGFAKDGTIAIEAALFADKCSIHINQFSQFSFNKFPLFKEFDLNKFISEKFPPLKSSQEIFAFDENIQNITASRKNAKLAKVNLNVNKCFLDELDVKFNQEEFDNLIFHITTKDESKINEIYYQANYILKPKGTFLIIGRDNWELPISEKFKLVDVNKIIRGDSVIKSWLLEKK